jgi:TPP-dependent pyruvate/acetoin dehydrogenase alpha subunit
MSARDASMRESERPQELAFELFRMMVRIREFEAFCIDLRARNEIVGNTYPSLGQEATGAVAFALEPADVVFPSYRSRPAFFGRGVTAEDHFRELARCDSLTDGREVFHHVAWPKKGVMPSSSMIGAWLPMAAGYAMAQKLEREDAITACYMGDGSVGAGDFHEALNIVGLWKLPFLLVCENNGYQVSQPWNKVRVRREIKAYAEPHGFECFEVDGNDALAVYEAVRQARGQVLQGHPVLLDCITYRMGSYSSHFPEPRTGIEAEKAEWAKRDPIQLCRAKCLAAGMTAESLNRAVDDEKKAITDAWQRIKGQDPLRRLTP